MLLGLLIGLCTVLGLVALTLVLARLNDPPVTMLTVRPTDLTPARWANIDIDLEHETAPEIDLKLAELRVRLMRLRGDYDL
jgi:hypothetical protein